MFGWMTMMTFKLIMESERTMATSLILYIEREMLQKYERLDAAYHDGHAQMVIKQSLVIARHYTVVQDMEYAIAAFHDLGLEDDRKTYHLESALIVRETECFQEWSSTEEIEAMAQAMEDHRASSDQEHSSIQGKIVAETDLILVPEKIIERSVQYSLSNYPQFDRESQWKHTPEHPHEKYAESGYLKLYFPELPNVQRHQTLYAVIKDEASLRTNFDKIYDTETTKTQ